MKLENSHGNYNNHTFCKTVSGDKTTLLKYQLNKTGGCSSLSLNHRSSLILERSSPRFFIKLHGNKFLPGKREIFNLATYLNRSIFWKSQGKIGVKGERAHASWIQHEACFIMGVRLKADLLHARGGSRARYGTIKGKSFRRVRRAGRISRAPDEPRCTLESEYPGITGGWRRRVPSFCLDFICRFIYEA